MTTSHQRKESTVANACLLAILVAAFWLRAGTPAFNTAFEDESFMILMGRSVLARAADVDIYMRTAFGWYLWPVASALADRVGGLAAVRILAGALGTAATYATFALGRRLFGTAAGLVAAALFAASMPTILTARIATHDAAAVPLVVLALLLLVRSWQTGVTALWCCAAVACFAFFTVKHPLASMLPAICVASMIAGRWRGVAFAAALSALVLLYAIIYRDTLLALLAFVQSFDAFRAPPDALVRIYVTERLDLWVVGAFAAVEAARGGARSRRLAVVAVAIAGSFAAAHVARRLDYHTWKHAAYPMIVLFPLAASGALRTMRRVVRDDDRLVALLTAVLAFTVHLLGQQGLVRDARGLPFRWPNTQGVADYLEPRLFRGQRLLIDDAALRYALSDVIPQDAMTDLYWFQYRGLRGDDAYAAAVADGYFDYLVFDGNAAPAALALRRAVDPRLGGRYVLRHQADQPSTSEVAQVFERVAPPVSRPPGSARLIVDTPLANGTVISAGREPRATVRGRVENSTDGMRVTVDVLTNRWYRQSDALLAADGTFVTTAVLGGTGAQRCHHVLRVRVVGARDRILDEVTVPNIRRAAPDSVAILCPAS